jgi:diacylglycerol O-acyltransferase / wax synthase
MPQLKTLDAALRKTQDLDQHTSLAIGAVAIVDGAAPEMDLLKRLIAERIQAIPRCGQTLHTHPFDVTVQQWIDHPGFDLSHHLHQIALARPGDDTELFRAIAHALERPLDLDRPLWECWVIEGLKGNQWALLLKVHQSMADGISAAHILTRLCDDSDSNAFANPIGKSPDSLSRGGQPGWADALERAAAVAGTVNSALTGMIWPASRRSAASSEPTRRRYSTVRVPIADVDTVCRKFGVTANDVALTAITEGFRTILLHRGERPRADSLRTLLPVSAGSADATGKPDDHISAMLPYLPVEHADSMQRLRTVHNQLKANQNGRSQSGRIVGSAINCLPIVLRGPAIQLLTGLPHRGVVTLATHTPGPRHQLRMLGKPMRRLLPIPPTALQLSSGVAVLSYGDELVFGLTADYEAARDIKRLAAGIEREMARLVVLSQDGVLLFTRDRRKRSSRTAARGTLRGRPSAATRAGR